MIVFEARFLNKSTALIPRSLGMSEVYSPRRYLSGNSANLYGATGFGPRSLRFEGRGSIHTTHGSGEASSRFQSRFVAFPFAKIERYLEPPDEY